MSNNSEFYPEKNSADKSEKFAFSDNKSVHNYDSERVPINNINEIDYDAYASKLTKSLLNRNKLPANSKSSENGNIKNADNDFKKEARPSERTDAPRASNRTSAENGGTGGAKKSIKKPERNSGTENIKRKTAPKPAVKKASAKKTKKASSKKYRKHLKDMNFLERFVWVFMLIVKMLIVLFCGSVVACLGAGLGVYISIIRDAPIPGELALEPGEYTSFVYDKDGNQIDEFHGDENRIYVTIDQIPQDLQDAIVAIEDERFYEHNGIDFRGIARAAYSIISKNDIQGASTITQQLIKNTVTKVVHNDFETKIKEQYLAVKYESALTEDLGSKEQAKKHILELYLNTINLSHGYYGVQVAAQGYYNKDVSELDLAECAVIASITNSPSRYSPRNNPEENKKRQTEVLKKMYEQGYITKEEYDSALAEDVYSSVTQSSVDKNETAAVIHTYFIDALFDQISKDLQDKYNISAEQANYVIYTGGLKVDSTFDPHIQSILDETFSDDSLFPNVNYCLRVVYNVSVEDPATGKQEHSEYSKYVRNTEEADSFVADTKAAVTAELAAGESIISDKATYTIEPQAAMVIEDYHTGYVKALIGGRGTKTVSRGFNRATDSARQPGSVFKVLAAFAPGIDMGTLTAATPIEDSPFKVGNYEPQNWYSGYRGMANPRLGIQNSMNIVAVKAMDMVGVDNCYDYLLNFGFTTLEDDNHLSTALGGVTHGVTQLEVTAAYSTIGNGGIYRKPTLYTKVYDHKGNILLDYDEDFKTKQVLSSGAAYILIDMMKDVITKGTGTAVRFRNSNMPVCGKTGTTTDSKDLTFVGLTPYYCAGIWLGYDIYDDTIRNMNGLNQTAHEVVWRTCMEKVHEGLEVKDFEKPDDVVEAYVCSYSGLLPNGCSGHNEYFVKGTEPTEYCKGHSASKYLDKKYITSGYDYSSGGNGNSGGGNNTSSSNRHYEEQDEPEVQQDNVSDDEIQNAYENEFGDLDNSGGDSSDGGGDNTDSGGTPEPVPAEPSPDYSQDAEPEH